MTMVAAETSEREFTRAAKGSYQGAASAAREARLVAERL
jgi:hypothetical protein